MGVLREVGSSCLSKPDQPELLCPVSTLELKSQLLELESQFAMAGTFASQGHESSKVQDGWPG